MLQNCLKEYSFDFLSGKRDGENILKPVQRIINLINEECFIKIKEYVKSMYN